MCAYEIRMSSNPTQQAANNPHTMDSFKEIASVVQACVNSSKNGILLSEFEDEFRHFYGSSVPYWNFGCDDVTTFLLHVPNIYIVKDCENRDRAVFSSYCSRHITEMVNSEDDERTAVVSPEEFSRLEQMLPLFYGWQALGDSFLLDIATKIFAYGHGPYVPQLGLCKSAQTIRNLTNDIKKAEVLAPRVLVMVGIEDIWLGRNITKILAELKELIGLLKRLGCKATFVTLVKPVGKFSSQSLEKNIGIFNKALLRFRNDKECDVIDLHAEYKKKSRSASGIKKLKKVEYDDQFLVFSKYGRKVFVKLLRKYLKFPHDY